MTHEFRSHRRVLLVVYRRYLRADRAWRLAQREARSWFPPDSRPAVPPIGDSGSRLRRLHDRRDKALMQLMTAYRTLYEMRRQNAALRVRALPLYPH
jgi:hypothetical protein